MNTKTLLWPPSQFVSVLIKFSTLVLLPVPVNPKTIQKYRNCLYNSIKKEMILTLLSETNQNHIYPPN